MFNPATVKQAIHLLIAAYAATGFAVAGIHAALLLKVPRSELHVRAWTLALIVGVPAAIMQPVSGDLSARVVVRWQPVKLAALESHFTTMRGAPLHIGGWPSEAESRTRYAVEIPRGLSLLAFHDPNAEVRGLSDYPRDMWPPVAPVHLAFQLMVALGTAMALIGVWVVVTVIRKRAVADNRRLLRAIVFATPFGFIATEAGWTVTEVGRQPWIVNGLVRTADAVTPMPHLVYPMAPFTLLYVGLAAIVVIVMHSIVGEAA